jgi:hypothetical protein
LPLDPLCYRVVRLAEDWPNYRVFDARSTEREGSEGAWTNNGTEQAIACMKMRARTVRGYKT